MTVPNNDLYAGVWVLPIGRVANVYTKNLTTTLAPTAIVNQPVQGLYRVTLSMAILTAGTAGDLTLEVQSATSIGGTMVQTLRSCQVNLAGDQTSDTFAIEITQAAAGAGSISIAVVAAGLTSGSLNYTVRAVVERLSIAT